MNFHLLCRYAIISLRDLSGPDNAAIIATFFIASVRISTSILLVSCLKKSNGERSPAKYVIAMENYLK